MWRAIYHELRRWAKISLPATAADRSTEITIETDRIWIIRKSPSTRQWCASCGREVDMVRLIEAGELGGVNQPLRSQSMLTSCGVGLGWHWSQAADGSPLVCLESVMRSHYGAIVPKIIEANPVASRGKTAGRCNRNLEGKGKGKGNANDKR
jgi:hypothetical protein